VVIAGKKLDDFIQQSIDGINVTEAAKKSRQKKYKEEKCASLQVFLDKNLVNDFKATVKRRGESQACVVKRFIESYLSS
jgi:vacuolar-type H+-ATPase subunit C/Vma6